MSAPHNIPVVGTVKSKHRKRTGGTKQRKRPGLLEGDEFICRTAQSAADAGNRRHEHVDFTCFDPLHVAQANLHEFRQALLSDSLFVALAAHVGSESF